MARVQHAPGPQPRVPGAGLKLLLQDQRRFVETLAGYGDVSCWPLIGALRVYLVNHPAYVQDVLVKQRAALGKHPLEVEILQRVLGNGLVTNQGADHKRQRKLMQPAFHMRRLTQYAQTMVDYTQRMLDTWQPGQLRDIAADMETLTLEIVVQVLFSASVSDAEARSVGIALDRMQDDLLHLSRFPIPWPAWLPLPINRRIQHETSVIDEVVLRVINERRGQPNPPDDLLTMLLAARYDDGSTMSIEQVRDEVITVFLAGQETTASALTWIFYLLAQHPAAAARLYAEVDAVLGQRPPTFADLPQLTWTEQVIKEALRLYPPSWLLSLRTAVEPVTVGGVTIEPGSIIMISPLLLHHDARWWPDPERFDPDRFTPEAERARLRHAFMPFGAGDRSCIGSAFAMAEMQLVLATVAQRVRFSLYPHQQVRAATHITLGPAGSVWLQIEPR